MFGMLALLSRIRFSRTSVNLESVARRQYLFPAAGAVLGIIMCIVAVLAFTYLGGVLDAMVISLLVLLFVYLLTGLIHLEGLADFGDGLMTSGDKERKRSAMKDISLGASGTFFMIVAVLALFLLLNDLRGWTESPVLLLWTDTIPIALGLILAETAAKLAMTAVMVVGPSSHQGMGSIFVSAASPAKFGMGMAIALVVGIALAGVYGFIVLLGPVAGVAIAMIARKHFGGVGGDAFGAANEVGRLLTLLVWVVLTC